MNFSSLRWLPHRCLISQRWRSDCQPGTDYKAWLLKETAELPQNIRRVSEKTKITVQKSIKSNKPSFLLLRMDGNPGSTASAAYLMDSSKSPVQFNGGYNTESLMNLFGPGKTAEVLCLICRRVSWNPESLSEILCKSILQILIGIHTLRIAFNLWT